MAGGIIFYTHVTIQIEFHSNNSNCSWPGHENSTTTPATVTGLCTMAATKLKWKSKCFYLYQRVFSVRPPPQVLVNQTTTTWCSLDRSLCNVVAHNSVSGCFCFLYSLLLLLAVVLPDEDDDYVDVKVEVLLLHEKSSFKFVELFCFVFNANKLPKLLVGQLLYSDTH